MREPGFYWVKIVPWAWVVKEWIKYNWNKEGQWQDEWKDEEFYEIGPRIQEPI